MPRILGVNYWGDSFFLWEGLKPWRHKAEHFTGKKCRKNSLRNLRAILLKFAKPKKSSTQICCAEPRDQPMFHFEVPKAVWLLSLEKKVALERRAQRLRLPPDGKPPAAVRSLTQDQQPTNLSSLELGSSEMVRRQMMEPF